MKSTADDPRLWDPEMKAWEVDLAADDQDNCEGCEAEIYWVWIRTKKGEVKRHPLSVALTSRREVPCGNCLGCPACLRRVTKVAFVERDEPFCQRCGHPMSEQPDPCQTCGGTGVAARQVFMGSHYADCPERKRFGG